MANNILITRNKGIQKQEILLLEFCKNTQKQKGGQREQTMSTMSTQHASGVGMILVMDSIPWVRCASGNVSVTYSLSLSSLFVRMKKLFHNDYVQQGGEQDFKVVFG